MGESLTKTGFEYCRSLLSADEVTLLLNEIGPLDENISMAGVRRAAAKFPAVARLSKSSEVMRLANAAVGGSARLVRSILFNKTETSNWKVPWHQDLTIAVQEVADVEGYSAWTYKDGIPHVQPPAQVLQKMITIRIHLDRTDEENGALLVVPGSHSMGRISAEKTAPLANQLGFHTCVCDAGDALLMRPLLLHASKKASIARPRRVVHLEYSGCDLPEPLQWINA